jgi:polar amino acid transport system permease protein
MGMASRPAWSPRARDPPPAPLGGSSGLARRRSRRRDTVISTVSTIVFFALVVALIAFSPGVNKVVESFFSVTGFEDSFGPVSSGFWLNVKLMLVAEAIVLVLALGIAVARSLPGPVMAPLRIVP